MKQYLRRCGVLLSDFFCLLTLARGQKNLQNADPARKKVLPDVPVSPMNFAMEIWDTSNIVANTKQAISFTNSGLKQIELNDSYGYLCATLSNGAQGSYLVRFRDEDDRIISVQSLIHR